jgi:hypothetical protein
MLMVDLKPIWAVSLCVKCRTCLQSPWSTLTLLTSLLSKRRIRKPASIPCAVAYGVARRVQLLTLLRRVDVHVCRCPPWTLDASGR